MRSFHLIVFGCQMNIHDAERIAGVMTGAGWRQTDEPSDADMVIFLTCCVRASAEERFWGRLRSLAYLKSSRGTIFAVGGCYAQLSGSDIAVRAPYVDLVFGTSRYTELPELIAKADGSQICSVEQGRLHLAGIPQIRKEPYRAWVPVTIGCNNSCAYCVVPNVRGREYSRPLDEILDEVESAVNSGVREIVLLGQNVSSYGRDRGESGRFPLLLREIAEKWPDVWIRFLTSHPRDFDEDLVEAIREHENICRYIHLPLQAGSDRVLLSMRRGYTVKEYLERVKTIRNALPDASISTDIIVGFPGEQESDFADTLRVVEECRFDSAYTFMYNPRPGTAAKRAAVEEVPEEVKKRRLMRLAGLVRELSLKSHQKDVGKLMEVLVEGEAPRSGKTPYNLRGRTRTNRAVNLRGETRLVGEVIKVRISRAGHWSLYADVEDAAET